MGLTTIRGGRQITDGTIPYVDIQNVAANTILGNNTAGATTIQEVALASSTLLGRGATGNITAVTVGSGLTFSGTIVVLASSFGDTVNPYGSKTANTVLAAPNGSAGVPTFRALVAADIPALSYEPTITAGTTAQYWRGDKSWQTLNTTAVAEGTNLYYTDARARAALSFTAGSGAYNSSTGVITIPTNTNQLTNGANFITGYTETDTLATVTSRGSSTTGGITINGATTITDGADLIIKAATSSTDSGDIVFQDGSGTELHRLWNGTNTLNYRTAAGTTYGLWHAGNLTNLNQLTNGPGYITNSALGAYLPLTGGALTGALSIKNSNSVVQAFFQSDHDFSTGAYIETDIAVSGGQPWTCEITAFNYGTGRPTKITINGYNYTGTYYNGYAISTGYPITGMSVFQNASGFLCLYIPTKGYWHAYSVNWYINYAAASSNRVTSITNAAKPGGISYENTIVPTYTLDTANYTNYAVQTATQSNWNSYSVIDNVVGLLAWKNYGNGHVIFDASKGTNPSGGGVSQTNPTNYWTASYPTLMGWNGTDTYGVRVDVSRYADSAGTAGSAGYATYLTTNYTSGQQTNPQTYFNYTIGLKVAMTGAWAVWSDTLWINGYSGGDVPNMCALHTLRDGTPRIAISVQERQATSYGTIYQFLTEYNWTSYAPTKTGGGASGTWGINVSGTAAGETLATVTSRGASTSTAVTFSNVSNYYSGHHYFIAYDANGNHYPQYLVGSNNNGAKINLRVYSGDGSTLRLFYLDGNTGGFTWDGYTVYHSGNFSLTDTLATVTSRGNTTTSIIGVTSEGVGHDPYGKISVTRGTDSNFSYFGLTRAGSIGWSIGVNTSNAFIVGTGASSAGIISTTQMALSNGGTLTVLGDVVAYGSPSDARYKTIKDQIPGALQKIQQLNGYRFDWIKKSDVLDLTEDIGVIAQEVASVFPELARVNPDGYMSVRYQGLTAVLIEAVKEQQTQIENLKKQIAYLAENR